MTEIIPVTYMKCPFCTAKNHCDRCGEELNEALVRKSGITAARVNVPDKTALLEHTLDADTLEDVLDGMGLLVG